MYNTNDYTAVHYNGADGRSSIIVGIEIRTVANLLWGIEI